MIRIEVIELIEGRDKIKNLGYLAVNEHLVPNIGDKLYVRQSGQLTVVEKQIRLAQILNLADITLVVENQSQSSIVTENKTEP